MIPSHGQINMESNLGKLLFLYGADRRFKVYVDIGIWNGQGSTVCIMNGILQRSSEDRYGVKLYALENNVERYKEAEAFWEQYPEAHPYLRLLYGRITDIPMKPIREYYKEPLFRPHMEEWYNGEREQYDKSENVLGRIRELIDVVVLDGGEFTTDGDFKEMLRRKTIQLFVLDDTNMIKCHKIVRFLERREGWLRVHGDEKDRNGYMIYQRIPCDDFF